MVTLYLIDDIGEDQEFPLLAQVLPEKGSEVTGPQAREIAESFNFVGVYNQEQNRIYYQMRNTQTGENFEVDVSSADSFQESYRLLVIKIMETNPNAVVGVC